MTEVFGPPRQVLSNIYEIAPEVLEQIALWLEQRGIRTPLSQITGWHTYVPSFAAVDTEQSTTSTSYTDLATVGPSIAGLQPGTYVVFWSCLLKATAADEAHMGLNPAGAGVDDLRAIISTQTGYMRGTSFNAYSITATGTFSLDTKYKSQSGGSATFKARTLMATKVA